MTEDDDDESDKHLEARDRRYSCLIFQNKENSLICALVYCIEVGTSCD